MHAMKPDLEAFAHASALAALRVSLAAGRRLSPGATLYVAISHTERLTRAAFEEALESDPGLVEVLDFMRAVCDAHGRPDGWPLGEGPAEFEALRHDWARQHSALRARLYAQAGQFALAELAQDGGAFQLACRDAAADFASTCVFSRKDSE